MTVYVSDQLAAVPATVKGDPTPATSWQWLRNNQPIAGATSSTYDVDSVDLGSELSVIQQAINVIGSASSVSVGTGTVADFTPSLMYRGGANGVWYDPSDFSTLFQDAAGTTPVTAVGQPVGLMLDKSKGLVLGPELVTNGDFGTTINGWTSIGGVTTQWSNGTALITYSFAAGGLYQDIPTTANFVQVEVRAKQLAGTPLLWMVPRTGNFNSPNTTVSVTSSEYFSYKFVIARESGATGVRIYLNSGLNSTLQVDSVSVRELPGNHAFNPSGNSANFPVLSARYNLLTKTEDFSDSSWTALNGAVKNSASSITLTATNSRIYQTATIAANVAYTLSVTFSSSDVGKAIRLAAFDSVNGWSVGNDIIVPTGGFISRTFTLPNSGTLAGFQAASTLSGSTSFTLASSKGIDLRVDNDALNQPAYQRVNTATDYDTVDFKPYLSFNGVNQWLQTNSIDFSYGDKMFVSAGVRKLSDVAIGILCEFSTSTSTNTGAFYMTEPNGAGPSLGFASKGSSLAAAVIASGYASPVTILQSGIGDISGSKSILRVNGAQAASSVNSQGTGNYGNYPLYIGARAGSSLWFNGRLYGLIIVGKAVRSVEITSTEAWLNNKTGAY